MRKNKGVFIAIAIVSIISLVLIYICNNYIDIVRATLILVIKYCNIAYKNICDVCTFLIKQQYDFSLNNREKAIITLTILFIMWVILFTDARSSVWNLIKALCSAVLIKIYILIFIYSTTVTIILYKLQFWKFTYTKYSIIWYFITAIYITFNSIYKKESIELKKLVTSSITIIIFFSFMQHVYTFSVLIEIGLMILLIFISMMIGFTKTFPEKDNYVFKFMTNFQMLLGFIIILHVIYNFINSPSKLMDIENLKLFLLPIIMTTSLIPLIYILIVNSLYSEIVTRLKLNKKCKYHVKIIIFLYILLKCNINRIKLIRILQEKRLELLHLTSIKEVKSIFHHLTQQFPT